MRFLAALLVFAHATTAAAQAPAKVDVTGTWSFFVTTQVQGYDVNVSYSGTVENADSMKGTMNIAGVGEGTFTATRKKS